MKKPDKRPDPSRLLDAVPIVNRAVRSEEHGDTLILYVPIRRRWWMMGPLSWMLPFRREKGVALDRLGSEVWQACDGQRTIESIIEQFASAHRIRFHEAKSSVLSFMRSLMQKNLVVIAVPKAAEVR